MERGWIQFYRLSLLFRGRPAPPLVVLLIVGIAFGDVLAPRPGIWLGIAAAFVLLAIVMRQIAPIAVAIVFLGLAAAQIQRFQFPSDSITNYATDSQRFAQIDAYIDQPPRLVAEPPSELRIVPPKQTVIALAEAVRTRGGWQAATGKIAVTLEQPNISLAAGQTVRLTGMLQKPRGPMNPGEFDYAEWCRRQRIVATLRIGHADGVQVLRESSPHPILWLRQKTRDLLAMGFDLRESYNQALLRAFVLGDSDPQLRDLDDKFVRTGMIHYLVVSGLHVAIVGAIALLICRIMRRSPRTSAIVALGAVLFYAIVADPTWPGWRSIILCGAATAGLVFRRAVDALQNFALAVAAVLLIHPSDLSEGGFQVSCAAVFGFLVFAAAAEKRFWSWWQGPDPPPFNVSYSPARMVLRVIGRWAVVILIGGCIAWAMCLPLIAYHFNQLNFWSVPAGIVVLPLTIVAMVAGIAKIILTLLWPSGAHAWALMAAGPVALMRHGIELLDRLPGASLMIAPPPIWLIVAYYGLILLFFIPIRGVVLRWTARAGATLACVIFFLLPDFAGGASPWAHAAPQAIHITLLSVGAGQTVIITTSAGHVVFIDDGSSTISDVGRSLIEPYFRCENLNHVDKVFLSHGDFDHISGTEEIFAEYAHPAIYTSAQFARFAESSMPAESLLRMLQKSSSAPVIIARGGHIDIGGGATIDVLWPPADCEMNSNNCGLVLKLNFAGESVLFPADIQQPAERALLVHPQLLHADVLIAPHHGSAETTTAAFLHAVHPRYILASNSEKLTRKQRVFDILAQHYPFYRTSKYGAIDVTIGASGQIVIDTFITPAATGSQSAQ
jgi:competence protein ComEC